MAPSALIDFAGDVRHLTPEDELRFGRGEGADLDIDDNPLLHRRFGRIWHSDGNWWIRNEGSRLPLSVLDRASMSAFTLAPGVEVSLTFPSAAIRFAAGASNYEIIIDLTDRPASSRDFADESPKLGAKTADHNEVRVAGAQRLLLVALAEQKLRNPHRPIVIPTNRSICHRLGWTVKQLDRKLDRICQKFDDVGIPHLVGGQGTHASQRRLLLVEHTVRMGIITASDLVLLEDYPG